MRIDRVSTVLLFEAVSILARGGLGGPVATGDLQQKADVIAVATVTGIKDTATSVLVELQLASVLQGQAVSASLNATIPPGPPSPLRASLFASSIGATGVWFLKNDASGYVILPLVLGYFSEKDLFIPIADASADSAPTGTIAHQILVYQTRWYQALPNPRPPDDQKIMASLVYNGGPDSSDVIIALKNSVSPSQHAFGLAAAIRLGYPGAVSEVADELDTLRSNSKFGEIVSTLEGSPPVRTPEAVSALERLIGLHSDIPGFDGSISTAFLHLANATTAAGSPLPTKAVLPGMIALLDSKDPTAQLRAAQFLGYYTLFADKNGNITGSGIIGPFGTADTRQFTPRKDSTLTPGQYAGFWKVWWIQNKAAIGL